MVDWYIDFSSIASLERIIEGLISLYTALLMLNAFKTILRDRNRILNDLDKLVFIIALCNSVVLTVYFFLGISAYVLLIIRALRLAQDVIVCVIFLIMLYKEKMGFLKNMGGVGCFFVFVLWICGVIFIDDSTDYDCANYIWIVFSGINLILSTLNIYSGYNSYTLMKIKYFNQQHARLSETNEMTPKNQFQEEYLTEQALDNTRFSLYALMGASFGSICVQFFWDYLLHVRSITPESCSDHYHSSGFGTLVLCLILKIASFLPSIWGIHYVFYYRNRNNFNTAKETEERSLSVFYDFRSDYMDDDTNDPEDSKDKN